MGILCREEAMEKINEHLALTRCVTSFFWVSIFANMPKNIVMIFAKKNYEIKKVNHHRIRGVGNVSLTRQGGNVVLHTKAVQCFTLK